MANSDLVPDEFHKISEGTPLLVEEKDVERGSGEGSMIKVASELSGLSLEIGDKITYATLVDAETTLSQDTAIQVSSNSEGEGQTGASTDVEQTENVASKNLRNLLYHQPQTLPTEEWQEIAETESPQSSNPEIRQRNMLFDAAMWMLLWEILCLGVPISEVYYATKYVRGCDSADKLPLILILMAIITFLILVGRILSSITRKLSIYDDNYLLPYITILVGDVLSIILHIAEIAYFCTIDRELCNEELYAYVYVVNNVAFGAIVIWIFHNRRVFSLCSDAIRQCISVACFKM